MILYLYHDGKSISATNVPQQRQQPIAMISGSSPQRAMRLMYKHHRERYQGKTLQLLLR